VLCKRLGPLAQLLAYHMGDKGEHRHHVARDAS
jgi:hypothetical protein